jgi:hypothetical protein
MILTTPHNIETPPMPPPHKKITLLRGGLTKKIWALFRQSAAGEIVWAYFSGKSPQGKILGQNDPRFLGSVFGFNFEKKMGQRKNTIG